MPGLASLLQKMASGGGPAIAQAYIVPIGVPLRGGDDEPLRGETTAFQYFPESISDHRSGEYQTKPIPGLSHPLYQWTSGTAREISFTVYLTRDRLPKVSDAFNSDPRNADINGNIAWLRSFTYPEYSTDGIKGAYKRPRPPRRLILGMQGVGLGAGCGGMEDEIYCIMTQCNVNRTGFFNDGSVRIATVELAFAEIIQHDGHVRPIDAKWLRDESYGLGMYPVRRRIG